MTLYRATAYVFFAAALVNILAAMSYEAPIFIAAAFSGFAAGVFFLGLGRIIELLTELRRAGQPEAAQDAYGRFTDDHSTEQQATKSAAEIRAGLTDLKARV